MNIKITKDINEATAITHAGSFHPDEVFASVILSKVVDNLTIIRVFEVPENTDKLVYDIGGGKFDHHQIGGNGKREDGTYYASCGLIWKEYGKSLLEKYDYENIDELWKKIDKSLIQYIDADDNGESPVVSINYSYVTLSKLIGEFNKKWDEETDNDIYFMEAVKFADIIFENTLKSISSKMKAKGIVDKAIEESKDNILYLDVYAPWKEFLLNSENEKSKDILYVIFPSNRGGYTVHTVPKELNSFESKKSLPQEWAGLTNEKLQEVTGVKTARFCHNGCFIATTETKEDAYELARLAINR